MFKSRMAVFKSWKLSKYKAVDMDFHFIRPSLTEPTRLLLGMQFEVSYNCDHAGGSLDVSLIFIWFNICYYDTRHRENDDG